MYKHLLVTGTIRSGTTFVGEVLQKATCYRLINEPFSYNHGIKGIKHWNPYTDGEVEFYNNLIDDFFKMKSDFKLHERKKSDRVLKQVIKSKAHLNYLQVKLKSNILGQQNMILKDPLSALLSKYLYTHYKVGVLILIRHPAAFYYSNKRLGWDFDMQHLFNQKELVEKYLYEEQKIFSTRMNYAERISLLWRCINKVLLSYNANSEIGKYWKLVTHEDICVKPQKVFNSIFNEFEIPYTSEIQGHISASTSKTNNTDVGGETHILERNSKNLKDYWKGKISDSEISALKSITEDIASNYYDERSWVNHRVQ